MIFLFKQVIFRFQPLIFQGVCNSALSSNCYDISWHYFMLFCFFPCHVSLSILAYFSSWWFQPIWKILVKMGSSSPILGVTIPNIIWVATKQHAIFSDPKKNIRWLLWRIPSELGCTKIQKKEENIWVELPPTTLRPHLPKLMVKSSLNNKAIRPCSTFPPGPGLFEVLHVFTGINLGWWISM